MRFDSLKRGVLTTVGCLMLAASAGAGTAGAEIPSSPSGQFGVCYDAIKVRVYDILRPELGGGCTTNETRTWWSRRGPYGPRGDKGPKGDPGTAGPQGPAGRHDRHFVTLRDDTTDAAVAKSDPETQVYYGGTGRRWVLFPSYVDVKKCAVSIRANDPNGWSGTLITTTYMKYYGWLIAEANKVNADGSVTPVNTQMDVLLAC